MKTIEINEKLYEQLETIQANSQRWKDHKNFSSLEEVIQFALNNCPDFY